MSHELLGWDMKQSISQSELQFDCKEGLIFSFRVLLRGGGIVFMQTKIKTQQCKLLKAVISAHQDYIFL